MNNPFSLENKTVLVTGGTSGIGYAVALHFAKSGASVVVTGRNSGKLEEIEKSFPKGDHKFIAADLLNADDITLLCKGAGNLDGFVNCAGIDIRCLFKFSDEKNFEKVVQTNFMAAANLTRQLKKKKKINKGGSILYIASVSAVFPAAGLAAYSASKAALIGFARNLAIEFAPRKIRVNTISPGMIETEMTSDFLKSNPQFKETDEKKYLLGYGSVDDICYVAQYFISGASRWVTGSNFIIDGGFSCHK